MYLYMRAGRIFKIGIDGFIRIEVICLGSLRSDKRKNCFMHGTHLEKADGLVSGGIGEADEAGNSFL